MNQIKTVVLVISIFAAIMMSGCKDQVPKNFFTDVEFPEQKIAENVIVIAEFSEYDRNVEKIKFTVANNGDEIFGTGENFRMQKMEDGKWRDVSVTGEFNLLGYIYEPGKTSSYYATLKDHVKYPLPEGQYRIGVGFTESPTERDTIAYGEFVVK